MIDFNIRPEFLLQPQSFFHSLNTEVVDTQSLKLFSLLLEEVLSSLVLQIFNLGYNDLQEMTNFSEHPESVFGLSFIADLNVVDVDLQDKSSC